jgi:predicted nucleic acid-binding protein
MARIVLDTMVFNRLIDGRLSLAALERHEVFATHVQTDELMATPDEGRRTMLLASFAEVAPRSLPTASAVWGASLYGQAKWGDGKALFEPMLKALNAKNGAKPNNQRDVLIAETAIENGCCLATDDVDLADVTLSHGGAVLRSHEL